MRGFWNCRDVWLYDQSEASIFTPGRIMTSITSMTWRSRVRVKLFVSYDRWNFSFAFAYARGAGGFSFPPGTARGFGWPQLVRGPLTRLRSFPHPDIGRNRRFSIPNEKHLRVAQNGRIRIARHFSSCQKCRFRPHSFSFICICFQPQISPSAACHRPADGRCESL